MLTAKEQLKINEVAKRMFEKKFLNVEMTIEETTERYEDCYQYALELYYKHLDMLEEV